MGRKSKLTESQWAEVERRMLAGESTRALAREFGVGEATLRGRKSAQVTEIKTVANQLVAAERALKALPISAQITARTRAAMLQAIEENVLTGVANGSATFMRLTAMANTELQKVNDADLLEEGGSDRLRMVAGLNKMANDAVAPALAVVNANKDRLARIEDEAEVIENEAPKVLELDQRAAAKAYQDFIAG